MTNEEIIANIAITIFGEEAVQRMIANGEDIPLHTIKGWSQVGPYKVKKGEHGIECKLWRKRKRKGKAEESTEEEDQISLNRDFYMCKSFLFTREQVERV